MTYLITGPYSPPWVITQSGLELPGCGQVARLKVAVPHSACMAPSKEPRRPPKETSWLFPLVPGENPGAGVTLSRGSIGGAEEVSRKLGQACGQEFLSLPHPQLSTRGRDT